MSKARLSAERGAPMPIPVFAEELRAGDGIGEAVPTPGEDWVVDEIVDGVEVGEVLVGGVVDEEVEEVG